jgi:Type IV secretion-system coupling protein DNA-binding domain
MGILSRILRFSFRAFSSWGSVVAHQYFEGKTVGEAATELTNQAYQEARKEQLQEIIQARQQSLAPSPKQLMMSQVLALAGSVKDYIFFGGEFIDIAKLDAYFFLCGVAGSGKTLLTQIAQAGVLKAIKPGKDYRAIIFDTKGDVLPVLEGLGIPYKLMNINDMRAVAWDTAADCTSFDAAEQLGYVFIPKDKSNDPFWSDSARAILVGVMKAFIYQHGRDWGLHDVINALSSEEDTLIKVLEGFPGDQGLINTIFHSASEKTKDGIKMQLRTHMQKLTSAAAHSQHASERVSLQDFLNSEGVLVISQDLTSREASNPVIQAMFRRLVDLICASPDSLTRRTFIFLDEIRFIGKLNGLNEVAIFGRTKGARLWFANQVVEGLYALYGKNEAEEILGNSIYKAVLRTTSPLTAKWAESLSGSIEVWEEVPSTGYGQGGTSGGNQFQRHKRERFYDSEFLNLPLPSRQDGLTGFFMFPTEGVMKNIPGDVLEALKPSIKDVPKQISKPINLQILSPWTDAEREKFTRNNPQQQQQTRTVTFQPISPPSQGGTPIQKPLERTHLTSQSQWKVKTPKPGGVKPEKETEEWQERSRKKPKALSRVVFKAVYSIFLELIQGFIKRYKERNKNGKR